MYQNTAGNITGVPVTIVAMCWGTASCWILGGCSPTGNNINVGQNVSALSESSKFISVHGISFPVVGIISEFKNALSYFGVILPIALQIFTGTCTSVELAKAAGGDDYNLFYVILTEGFATVIGALCGCTFQTVTYPNHPAYKRLGGKIGYNIVTPFVFGLMAFFGLLLPFVALVPIQSIVPNIVLIGLTVSRDSLVVCEERHYIAFIVGTLPSIAAWAASTTNASSTNLGLQYMAGGSLIVGLFWTSIVYHMTEKNHVSAAAWTLLAAISSIFGLIHAPSVNLEVGENDIGWKFTIAYLQTAIMLIILHINQKYYVEGKARPSSAQSLPYNIMEE